MCSEEFVYQLRHIGPPPSCKKVPNIMRLGIGVTKIGRGQNNDYFLDSIKLKNFISRYHAEVLGRMNENGEMEFVLTDKGLNGTFINDYRTQKTCHLEIGDKITFGHTNGYKIQPGCFACQPDSEFQFMFEQVPKSSHTEELSSDNFNREESSEATHDQKKYTERTFLSDKHSNIQSPQITSTKDLQRNSDSENEENQDIDTSASVTKTDIFEKGSSKGSHTKDKKSLDKSQESVSPKSEKTTKEKDILAETLPAVDNDDGDDKDDDDDGDEEKGSDSDEIKSDDSVDKKGKKDEKSNSSSSEEEVKPKKTVKQKKCTKRSFTKPKPKPKAKESKDDVVSFSDESSEDEEPPKPPPRGQRSVKKSGSSNTASSVNKGSGSRKRNLSGQKGSTESKRRRTAGGRGKRDTKGNDNDLSDGVEWYDEETCEADDCKRPKNKRTPWVQCDDCDGWYHTVCVGANYKQVKDDNASFSCGCT